MKFQTSLFINLRKLIHQRKKSLYLILPLVIISAISITGISQVANIRSALSSNVFDEVYNQLTMLRLEYPVEIPQPGQSRMGTPSSSFETQYSELDLANILALDGVNEAQLVVANSVSMGQTADLIEGENLTVSNLVGLSEEFASYYTSEDLTYADGEEIPIILNSTSFMRSYQDWDGQTEITVDFRSIRESGGDLSQATPIKTESIEYDTDELIGKTITVNFGGFSEIADFTNTREMGVMKLTKLTDDEVTTLEATRKDVVSKYWDYDLLETGVAYTFKVVGVVESETDRYTYVPEAFITELSQALIDLQLSAQITEPSTDILESTFTGLKYDGTEITSGNNGMRMPGGATGGMGRDFGPNQAYGITYEIPGLIIKTDSSGNVTGLVDDINVFEEAVKSSSTIMIKFSDVSKRASVISELNSAGYAYQDVSNLAMFTQLHSSLNQISGWIYGLFFIGASAVILFVMGKYVADSTKEIGIFRAIGYTQKQILAIFVSQSFIYVSIAALIGLGIGYILNLLSSLFIYDWFKGFIDEVIAEGVVISAPLSSSQFVTFDVTNSLILVGVMVGLSIVIGIFPAYNASKISPVVAIKAE